jgi:hypothetical protein
MTWSITFEVKGGGVNAESVKVAGTPPDGVVTVGGHQNGPCWWGVRASADRTRYRADALAPAMLTLTPLS